MGDKKNEIIVYNEKEIIKSSEKLKGSADATKLFLMLLSELIRALEDVRNELERLNSDLNDFNKVVGNASSEGSKSVESLKKGSEEAEKASTTWKKVFSGIAKSGIKAFKDITNKMVDFAGKAINLASDLEKVDNTIENCFPKEAANITEWSKNAVNAFGMSEIEAKKFNISMGNILKSMGISSGEAINMSQGIVGLAGD